MAHGIILRFYLGMDELHRTALEELEALAGRAEEAPPSLAGDGGGS